MEIERKFLIAEVPRGLDAATSSHLRQGYLAIDADNEVRLRDANGSFTLGVKSGTGMIREEREVAVDREQFDALWPATDGRRLKKRRYTLPEGDLTYELDVYEGALAGLAVVEVEFVTAERARDFVPPAWFGVDVTEDPSYKNASLALRGAPCTPSVKP